ncbi:MAG: SHOCT domain-containing protein [Thaumarchaeota archaeon]|nr:MAG: SHOCT domain-containing protein [Nitrososphaerota archaeon]
MGDKHSFNTDITDGDELNEIEKIEKILSSGEKVLLVARESRLMPGGSAFTPNSVIATDRRVIIRDPYMLGLKADLIQEGVIEALPKDKAEELLEIIRRRMKATSTGEATSSIDTISIADEIEKLSKLKQNGILSEAEFQKMKQQLLEKM